MAAAPQPMVQPGAQPVQPMAQDAPPTQTDWDAATIDAPPTQEDWDAATIDAQPTQDDWDNALISETQKKPNFFQNVGRLVKSGAGAIAGAVSKASPKLRKGIIDKASRIPDITLEDVKNALYSSLRDVDQATLNIPSEFLDMMKAVPRIPDAALQSIIDVWNVSGRYDINLNPREPTLQAGNITEFADKYLPSPQTPSGKAVVLGGEFLLGGKGLGRIKPTKLSTEQALINQTAKKIKKSGSSAELIKKYLGLEDLSKVDDFQYRFPNMAEHGVTTGKKAAKMAGQMYDEVPKLKGFQSHLDVTKINPKTGKSYGDLIEEFMLSTTPEMLPPALLKKIRPGAGPFTIADRYLATQALRLRGRTSNNPQLQVMIKKYTRAMQNLDIIPGQADEAYKMIKKADSLYAEAMAAENIGKAVTKATTQGKAYTQNVLEGTDSVKASDVLKGMAEIGDEEVARRLGANWKIARAALRKIGDGKLSKQSWGILSKVIGSLSTDWRILSAITGGSIVGTPTYHAVKALKAAK